MLELGVAAIVVLTMLAAFVFLACLAFVARVVLWVVLLPLKLLLFLVFLPLLILKLLIGAIVGVIVMPILALAGLLVALTVSGVILIPLAPVIVIIAAVFWLIKKDRPTTTTLPARSA
jgi:hypothetical protein